MRYWAECTCGEFKSAESLTPSWADAEGRTHLVPFMLADDNSFKDHTIYICHREVKEVASV